jgi:hypothetical protein
MMIDGLNVFYADLLVDRAARLQSSFPRTGHIGREGVFFFDLAMIIG